MTKTDKRPPAISFRFTDEEWSVLQNAPLLPGESLHQYARRVTVEAARGAGQAELVRLLREVRALLRDVLARR